MDHTMPRAPRQTCHRRRLAARSPAVVSGTCAYAQVVLRDMTSFVRSSTDRLSGRSRESLLGAATLRSQTLYQKLASYNQTVEFIDLTIKVESYSTTRELVTTLKQI
jgi:hypothetical protein